MANEAGPFNFWLRFGSVTGLFQTCSFAKASPEVKNPGSERLHYFLKSSSRIRSIAVEGLTPGTQRISHIMVAGISGENIAFASPLCGLCALCVRKSNCMVTAQE